MKIKHFRFIFFALLTLGSTLLFAQTAEANTFRTPNTYNAYRSVATVNGTWGANLFQGYDQASHPFVRVLPKGSQWRVYGYVKNGDTYWYDLGANQYVQGSQVRVPIGSAEDAILNVAAKYGETSDPDYHWGNMSNGQDDTWFWGGSWGSPYVAVDEVYLPAWAGVPTRMREFVVYPDGSAYQVTNFF